MLPNKNAVVPTLFSVLMTTDSIYCGMSLAEIKLPQKCSLLGLVKEGQVITVKDNPVIHPGDCILATVTHPMMLPVLEVILKRIHSVVQASLNR